MTTTAHYYGMLAEKLGITNEIVTIQNTSETINLRAYFEGLHPELAQMSYQIAVNQEIRDSINHTETINEIALLPPFAGG